MTHEEVQLIQARLREKFSEVDQKAATFIGDLQEVAEQQPTILQDINDHAKVEGELNRRIGLHDHYVSVRSQVRNALRKIENGTFGVCDGCGEDIGQERMSVQPAATRCIYCQQLEETKQVLKSEPKAWVTPERFNAMYWGAA